MIKIKAVLPKGRSKLDPARQRAAIEIGLADAKDAALKDFEGTTRSWSHGVEFSAKQQKDGWLIGTSDEVWNWLDKGTKAHSIVAQRKALRFPSAYRAKTRPGSLSSGSGGPTGGAVFRPRVMHPGTKARSWSTLIRKKYEALLGRFVQRRISEAVR